MLEEAAAVIRLAAALLFSMLLSLLNGQRVHHYCDVKTRSFCLYAQVKEEIDLLKFTKVLF